MNIIIPIGGIGKRFMDAGYKVPKPLIPIHNKEMIIHVIEHIKLSSDDKLFIVYHTSLDEYDFSKRLKSVFPWIHLIPISYRTKGSAETVLWGINFMIKNQLSLLRSCVIVDCDTLYHVDIIDRLRNRTTNGILYFEDKGDNPIYSYDRIENGMVVDIMEKEKISNYANTGCYYFNDINELRVACENIIAKNMTFKNEYYISCVIKEMLEKGNKWEAIEMKKYQYSSLGTPEELDYYCENHFSFLFDLDGTLVKTDEIYYKVWKELLESFNVFLTPTIFNNYIQGNNDDYAMVQLSIGKERYDVKELSKMKNKLFKKYIDEIIVIDGSVEFVKLLKERGYSICIVSNSNRDTCEEILKYIGIFSYIDYVVIGNECVRPKPYSDPYIEAMRLLGTTNDRCIIFEDSKPGLISAQNICPRNLIGVDNGTNCSILEELGIKNIIQHFENMEVDEIIKNTNMGVEMIQEMIYRSISKQYNIKSIIIDATKLKGGYISDVIQVKIELMSNESINCVLKYENNYTSSLTKIAYELGLFDREYYFYENISKYINIHIPKYIGTLKDSNYISKGILLENINQSDFYLGLDLNKESIDVSFCVIEQCAKFHSQFWNKDLLKSFSNLKRHNNELFCPGWGNFVRSRWPIFIEKWKHIISDNVLLKLQYIKDNFDMIQERLSNGHLTLCHGDVKSGNIFYKKVEISRYIPYFIDWQYVANGKGVQDIVFFMIESFNLENIKQYMDICKTYYYIKLKEYGIHNYTKEEYNDDFRDAICYFPFFVAIWFGTTANDELIDISFPFIFIQKLLYVIDVYFDLKSNEYSLV